MFLQFCTVRRNPVNYEDFVSERSHDLNHDRYLQVLFLERDDTPVGTAWAYDLDLVNGTVFVSIFLDARERAHGYGTEALGALLLYLFSALPIHKAYMDVLGNNTPALSSIQSADASEEGRFRGHRYLNGARQDVVRLAIYREHLDRISKLVGERPDTAHRDGE